MIEKIKKTYHSLYKKITWNGNQPNFLNHQWSTMYQLVPQTKRIAKNIQGNILDLGCGSKPYANLFKSAQRYIGVDITPEKNPDIVINPSDKLPFPDSFFDAVVSFQVLEHIENLDMSLIEIKRVLKKDGLLIVTAPFIFPEHGQPHDYRRLNYYGLKSIFYQDYTPVETLRIGGIGSTIFTLYLNFIHVSLSQNTFLKAVKLTLTPFLLIHNIICNAIAVTLDQLDKTNSFYHNNLHVYKKI